MSAQGSWTCDRCGQHAGTIELDDEGVLRRTSFTSALTLPQLEPDAVSRILEAVAAEDSAALFAIDLELTPWWCPTCERTYCGDHWLRWDTFDDEGFHEDIRGRCPEGHARMLED
jgi:hypothetical protein